MIEYYENVQDFALVQMTREDYIIGAKGTVVSLKHKGWFLIQILPEGLWKHTSVSGSYGYDVDYEKGNILRIIGVDEIE